MQGDLVQRAQRGDHEAFDMLAGAAYDRLSALAYRILRDSDRTQDAVQECLVHAWRDVRGLRDPSRFEAWLQRLLVNACYDESRRRRQRSVEVHLLPLDRAAPGDAARDLADRDELERGFRRLPIEQRAVLVMHHYLDLRLPVRTRDCRTRSRAHVRHTSARAGSSRSEVERWKRHGARGPCSRHG